MPNFEIEKQYRALDLFCGGGGATKGLQRAGFHVTGVDIAPQENYCGDEFIQADAFSFDLRGFDFVWASPMCQKHTQLNYRVKGNYPEQIAPIREKLKASGLLYVIENVPNAPLESPIMLCGTMFGLKVIRHRLFEINFQINELLPPCNHWGRTAERGKTNDGKRGFASVTGHNFHVEFARKAMDIDWMSGCELAQAIPPAYSEFLGRQIVRNFETREKKLFNCQTRKPEKAA